MKNISLCMGIICLLLLVGLFFPAYAVAGTFKNHKSIAAFYLERNGEPLWLEHSKINTAGRELLLVLKQSWMNGLNPNAYYVNKFSEITDNYNFDIIIDEEDAVELELLLTDGYINYVRDLSGMRINARDMGLNPEHWRQRISTQDALSFLAKHKSDIAEFLLLREPQTRTYQRLKSELVKLVEEYGSSDIHEKLEFSDVLSPGRAYNGISRLRVRLGLGKGEQQNSYIYGDDLIRAVMRFQLERGLKPDGLLGKQTLSELNKTPLDRIKQLIVNMERLRWVDDVKPARFVVVNIPSATLWAIDNGKVKFEMPVVVGRKKRPTRSFVTNIRGVRFNPSWTVPPTIKREDILPKLQENPSYLLDKGIELYDGYGKDFYTLDPVSVDWNTISNGELHGLRMVQIPGKHNPLGFIRILMPNKHNIYLHDTNDKALFSRADRAKSSGCVRLKYPEKVALFALENSKSWSESSMRSILKTGKTKEVYSSEEIAIYLLYYTVWLGKKNQIIYGSDIYGYDKTLLQLLEKLDGFSIIGDNGIVVVQTVD